MGYRARAAAGLRGCRARGAGRGGAGVPGRVARRAWGPGARSLAAPIPRHGASARALRRPKFAGRCGSTPARPGSPRAPGAPPVPETRGARGGGRAARGRGGAGPGRLHPSAPRAACPGLELLLPNFPLPLSLSPFPSSVLPPFSLLSPTPSPLSFSLYLPFPPSPLHSPYTHFPCVFRDLQKHSYSCHESAKALLLIPTEYFLYILSF